MASIVSAEAGKASMQKEYVMPRLTSLLFNKLFRSQKLSRSYSRPLRITLPTSPRWISSSREFLFAQCRMKRGCPH